MGVLCRASAAGCVSMQLQDFVWVIGVVAPLAAFFRSSSFVSRSLEPILSGGMKTVAAVPPSKWELCPAHWWETRNILLMWCENLYF